MNLEFWTGPIPYPSRRHKLFLDFLAHPIKRHLARVYLRLLKSLGCTVIGVTGSFGKTTTKEAIYTILSRVKPAIRTTANIDPVYNIPTTILRCRPWTKYLILEMGIEYLGEMDFYLWLAPVDIAIITGIGLTHTEFLKDTTTIYREKSKIAKYAKQVIDFARVKPSLKNNRLIATKVAKILNISSKDITAALANFTPAPHRMHRIDHSSGAIIIDDTYNANPTAVKLALEEFAAVAKKENRISVFVFGQMNELGRHETIAHRKIGQLVKALKIKHLLTVGPATKETVRSVTRGRVYPRQEALLENLRRFLNPKHIILIKGSRSWKLEQLVEKISSY